MRVRCLAQGHHTMSPAGLEPGPLAPESSALTMRPPRLRQEPAGSHPNQHPFQADEYNYHDSQWASLIVRGIGHSPALLTLNKCVDPVDPILSCIVSAMLFAKYLISVLPSLPRRSSLEKFAVRDKCRHKVEWIDRTTNFCKLPGRW